MPTTEAILEELAKDASLDAKGVLVAWIREVEKWRTVGNVRTCLQAMAFGTLKSWLEHLPIDHLTRKECLKWLMSSFPLQA